MLALPKAVTCQSFVSIVAVVFAGCKQDENCDVFCYVYVFVTMLCWWNTWIVFCVIGMASSRRLFRFQWYTESWHTADWVNNSLLCMQFLLSLLLNLIFMLDSQWHWCIYQWSWVVLFWNKIDTLYRIADHFVLTVGEVWNLIAEDSRWIMLNCSWVFLCSWFL